MNIAVSSTSRPRLARQARLDWDSVREQHILLAPEGIIVMNQTGAGILELCDGQRTVADIVAELGAKYDRAPDEEVRTFLSRLASKRLVEFLDE